MRRRIVNALLVLMVGAALGTGAAAQGGQGAPPAGGQRQGGAQGQGGGRGGGRGFSLPPLLMETDAYPDGGIIPPKYVSANNGGNVLPGFKISNAPAGTVAYALIFHDLDVALGGPGDVLHMMAWNIPAASNGWSE